MAKIKTLVESLKGGYEKAFDNLDKKVENLGEIEISNVKDTIYPAGYGLEQNSVSHIERVVIYEEKKKIIGQPWKAKIDMDLMDFLEVSCPPGGVEKLVKRAYEKGKTTIRELIAMPYSWFFGIDAIEEYRRGIDNWDLLKRELRRYGFKLYKKGYVVKD